MVKRHCGVPPASQVQHQWWLSLSTLALYDQTRGKYEETHGTLSEVLAGIVNP